LHQHRAIDPGFAHQPQYRGVGGIGDPFIVPVRDLARIFILIGRDNMDVRVDDHWFHLRPNRFVTIAKIGARQR
jgi:hypothetical protein